MIRLPKIKLKSCFVVFSFNPHLNKVFISLYFIALLFLYYEDKMGNAVYVFGYCDFCQEQLPFMMWKSARCFRSEISQWIGLFLKPPLVSRFANWKLSNIFAKTYFILCQGSVFAFCFKRPEERREEGKSIQPFWRFTKDSCSFTVHWSEKSK